MTRNDRNQIQESGVLTHDQLQFYLMKLCGVSWWLLDVACDPQSNCTMARHWSPPWWAPQRCGHDASSLQQRCTASWTCGLLMVTSIWSLGALSWSHSPYRPAGSSPAFPLTGGLEGPERPAHHPLPLLKNDGGQHDYLLIKREDFKFRMWGDLAPWLSNRRLCTGRETPNMSVICFCVAILNISSTFMILM